MLASTDRHSTVIAIPNDTPRSEVNEIIRSHCPAGYNWDSQIMSFSWDGDFTIYKPTFYRNGIDTGQQAMRW